MSVGRFGGVDGIKAALKKYGSGAIPFFDALKDDGDIARVRFLYTNPESLDLELIHEVEDEGKKKRIVCLEADCPLCENLGRPRIKAFIFLYNYTSGQVEVWDRGPTIINDLIGYIERKGDLNNRDYEIKRHGKKGDSKTRYQLFDCDLGPMIDPKTKQEIPMPEKPNLYKTMVLRVSAEEMADMLARNVAVPRDRVGSGSKKSSF